MNYSIKSVEENNKLEPHKVTIIFENGEEEIYEYKNKYNLYEYIHKNKGKADISLFNCYLGELKYNKKEKIWEEDEVSFSTGEFKEKYGYNCEINSISIVGSILKKIFISDVKFANKVIISSCKIYIIDLGCCTFESEWQFYSNQVYKKSFFTSSEFKGKINSFTESKFHDDTNFSGNEFNGLVNFAYCVFDKDVHLGYNKFLDILALFKVSINGKTDFYESSFKTSIDMVKARFGKETYFVKNEFKDNIKFDRAYFENLVFSEVIFDNELNLNSAESSSLTFTNCTNKSRIHLGENVIKKLCMVNVVNEATFSIKASNKKILKACQNYKEEYIKVIKNYNTLKQGTDDAEKIEARYGYLQEENSFKMIISETLILLKENFLKQGKYDCEDYMYFWHKHYSIKPDKHIYNKELKSNCSENKLNRTIIKLKIRLKYLLLKIKYILKYIVQELMGGFGTRPLRVIMSMFVIVLIFSIAYWKLNVPKIDGFETYYTFFAPIYFSASNFLSYGSGRIQAWSETTAILTIIEAFCGLFMISYLFVAFARKLLR